MPSDIINDDSNSLNKFAPTQSFKEPAPAKPSFSTLPIREVVKFKNIIKNRAAEIRAEHHEEQSKNSFFSKDSIKEDEKHESEAEI